MTDFKKEWAILYINYWQYPFNCSRESGISIGNHLFSNDLWSKRRYLSFEETMWEVRTAWSNIEERAGCILLRVNNNVINLVITLTWSDCSEFWSRIPSCMQLPVFLIENVQTAPLPFSKVTLVRRINDHQLTKHLLLSLITNDKWEMAPVDQNAIVNEMPIARVHATEFDIGTLTPNSANCGKCWVWMKYSCSNDRVGEDNSASSSSSPAGALQEPRRAS